MRLKYGGRLRIRIPIEHLLDALEPLIYNVRRNTASVLDQQFVDIDLVYKIVTESRERAEVPLAIRPGKCIDNDGFDLGRYEFIDLTSCKGSVFLKPDRDLDVISQIREL